MQHQRPAAGLGEVVGGGGEAREDGERRVRAKVERRIAAERDGADTQPRHAAGNVSAGRQVHRERARRRDRVDRVRHARAGGLAIDHHVHARARIDDADGREEIGAGVLPQHERCAGLHVDVIGRIIRPTQAGGGFDDHRTLVQLERIVELSVVAEDAQRSQADLAEDPAVRAAAVGLKTGARSADGQRDVAVDVEGRGARAVGAAVTGGELIGNVGGGGVGGDVERPPVESNLSRQSGEAGRVAADNGGGLGKDSTERHPFGNLKGFIVHIDR